MYFAIFLRNLPLFQKKEISRNLGSFSESEKIYEISRNFREILHKIIEIQTEMTKTAKFRRNFAKFSRNLGLIWRNLRDFFWRNKALLKRNTRFPQASGTAGDAPSAPALCGRGRTMPREFARPLLRRVDQRYD